MKIHGGEKSNKCNQCDFDKTLKSAGYLEKHISSVHRVQMKVVKTIEGHIGLCFQMCPQIARLRGCIVALVACVLM